MPVLFVCLLLSSVAAAFAADAIEPRQVFAERRFAALHHKDLVPRLLANEDAALAWFLATGCRLAAMRWDEQVGEELAIPWEPLRVASVEYTFAARLDLLELLIATVEAVDDERIGALPGERLAGLSRLLCRSLRSGSHLFPHAYGSDLAAGGRVGDQVERRDRLRQRWRKQLARWPEWRLDAWVHSVLEDPSAVGQLASLPDILAVDAVFDQEAILGYPEGRGAAHMSLFDLVDVVLRITEPGVEEHWAGLPADCRSWLRRARACSAWQEEDWSRVLDDALTATVDVAELAHWALLIGRADHAVADPAVQRLAAAALAAGMTDPAWTDRIASVVIARRGPAGFRVWQNGVFDSLAERHGEERALAWAFACVGRPRLLPAALGRLGRLTSLPAPQRRQVNRRLANLFNGNASHRHNEAAWFFIAASPLADPGSEFDPCLFEGEQYNRLDDVFVPFRIARALPDWRRKGGSDGFLATRLAALPDGIGKVVLQGLSRSEQSGCGPILNKFAAEQERLPLRYRERILYEMRHVIGRRVDYGILRPSGLDAGGAALFDTWYKQVDDQKRRWAEGFLGREGPFDPKELASWTAAIADADPGLALRLLRHAADRFRDGDHRPGLARLRETVERLWADPSPAVDAVVLRLLADPSVELLLLPDDDWAGVKTWRKRAKNYRGGLPALLRDLHRDWSRVLPSSGLAPLLPCLIALLDLLADKPEFAAAWLDDRRTEVADDPDSAALARLWLVAEDHRRLHHGLREGADDSMVLPLADRLASWYREQLTTASSSSLRLFVAGQAADRERTWQVVHYLAKPCLDEQELPQLLSDLLAHLRLGQAWPIPAGDALWDRLLVAAEDPAFAGPVDAWLDLGHRLRTSHPASAARSYRIRDAWARAADDDQHRLLAGLLRLALHRQDQARVGVLVAAHDEILLRSSGVYADLTRYAEVEAVVRLFEERWRRIDREPFAGHYDAELAQALAPVLAAIADADLRLLLRSMLESLPTYPRPDGRRVRFQRALQRLPGDPKRDARVDALALAVRDHAFADVAKQRRCVWFLMGLGQANAILAEAIDDCAEQIGYAGLEQFQETDPWAFRMGYWCLKESLLRAGRGAAGDRLLALVASAEGAGRTELGYQQRDLQSLLLDVAVQASWRKEDWRALGAAGRRAIDWYVGDRIWTAKRLWKWVVPVSLLAGDQEALATWLSTLPDGLRREVTATGTVIRMVEDLREHPTALIRAALNERIRAWLDHPALVKLLPIDPEQLGRLSDAGLLTQTERLEHLQAMTGSQRGRAWEAIALLHREAGRLKQAIAAYESAMEVGRMRDRREWRRAIDHLQQEWQRRLTVTEAAAVEEADAGSASDQAEPNGIGTVAPSAEGF